VKCSGQADGQPIQYNLQCDFCTRSGIQCVWRPPKRTMASTSTRRRPNTAARPGSAQDAGDGSNAPSQYRSACTECRRRKQRCTGDRPSCRFCGDKGMACSYEVADGMTRSEDLKSKVREATERGDRLDQLVDAMRQGTDQQSSELLARLRVGATVEDLLDPESRPNHFPEYIRNGEVDRPAWLERSGSELCLQSRAIIEDCTKQTPDMQTTAAEDCHDAASTSTTSPSYSFNFSMPAPRLSPGDIDQANNPFNRSFPPS
jgi:hypothetical protein